jgi:hypothetical protein
MAQDPNVIPFQYPIQACKTSNSAGSQLLVQNTYNCSATPILYTINNTTAIAANASTASLQLTAATVDGVALPTLPASVTLRANSRLYLGASGNLVNYVSFPREVTINSASATTVDIDNAATAVAAAVTGQTYAMLLVEKTTDLPINVEAETSNTRVLADGLQITQNVTGLNLNTPVTFFSSPEDESQFIVLQRAALTTANIYALIVKTSGNLAFGTAKVLGVSYTGDFTDEVATTTLNFQSWAVAHSTSDVRVNSAVQLAAINRVYKLVGLPTIV